MAGLVLDFGLVNVGKMNMLTRDNVLAMFERPNAYCLKGGQYSYFAVFLWGIIHARGDLFPRINEYAWAKWGHHSVGWEHVLLLHSGFEREEARQLVAGSITDQETNDRARAAMRAFLVEYFREVLPVST